MRVFRLQIILFVIVIACSCRSKKQLLSKTIQKPIVILMGGQSNMTGLGEISELSTTGFGNNITYHNFGMGGDMKLKPDKFGPEAGLAEVLNQELPQLNFILIKYSVGASSLLDWATNYSSEKAKITGNERFGNLYSKFKEKVDSVLLNKEYTIGAMLWMQGERDAKIPEAGVDYYTNFTSIIAEIRQDFLYPELPFLFGEVNPDAEHYPALETVRNAQIKTEQLSSNNYLIETDDLDKYQDKVHYTSQGLLTMGKRFGNQLVKIFRSVN